MILKGSQRGGALKLAAHLSRLDENDHVEVEELRGFSAHDLRGALQEVEAIAKGTRCKQYLFSLSFNPPETERVSVEQFRAAIERAEETLGLQGQARATVFHEKEGRRHAHVVWSRINIDTMTAIALPFYKRKLNVLAKELFLEHGWRLPEGLRDRGNRNPLNFTIGEWQQAKRVQQDARALKVMFQECWSLSDNRASFEQALEEKGFLLARGERRGFVAIDYQGEDYSLSRWTGASSKELKGKLGEPAALRDVEAAKGEIARRMTPKLANFIREVEGAAQAAKEDTLCRKADLKDRQRMQRESQKGNHVQRSNVEAAARAARFRSGVRGLWDFLTGRSRAIKRQNEAEAVAAAKRDAQERERMIAAQLAERRLLQRELREARKETAARMDELRRDVAFYMGFRLSPEAGAPQGVRKGQAKHAELGPDL